MDFINKNQSVRLFLTITLMLVLLQNTYAFAPVNNQQIKKQELVVLIHGLMRTSTSMFFLKHYLQKQGYQVDYFVYPSAKYTIHQHSMQLTQYLDHLIKTNPGVTIHFVTHSMGGILVREALSNLGQEKLQHIGYLVMLAPPNQGSQMAKMSVKMLPVIGSFIRPIPELSSEKKSYVHQVPIPKIKMGIIVGRYDAKVPPASGRLAGPTELRVVNSTHTFIMNNSEARKLISTFLAKGTFNG